MATTNYITPIMDRTSDDVIYARSHQADLTNKNKGAWNYTDANRVCNNLKYAAEYMFDQGFLTEPYSMQIKSDWKETDIITYETLNTMIVKNMNNLKTYSRPDLPWYPIASIANMDYSLANALERNIHMLATQVPIPPDKYKLTVNNGKGSGEYEAGAIITITANEPEKGKMFSGWSGDHLENIKDPTNPTTTYEMPPQDVELLANYTDAVPHTLKIVTYTETRTIEHSMGEIEYIEADPAPQGKVFHHWTVSPSEYENKLYEPAASTHFTMPNEAVTLTAVYITKGEKQLVVRYGKGSGWYDYGTYAPISSNKNPEDTFTSWSGDTQYLTGPVTQEYNSVLIPDVNVITLRANWSVPPVTNVPLKIVNGTITAEGSSEKVTEGTYTQGDRVSISANAAPAGQVFAGWNITGNSSIANSGAANTTVTIGTNETVVTATYRTLEYHTLTVITHSGTTTRTLEKYDYFTVDANPMPDGYTFNKWTGDTATFKTHWYDNFDVNSAKTGCGMGSSDRTITATYRAINSHTLTVKQLSGDTTYTQDEFSTISITAENAPEGKRFTGWSKSGPGTISNSSEQTITFTFGNGDTTLTANYVNRRHIKVIDGTFDSYANAIADEGREGYLRVRDLKAYERFDGWTQQNGIGTIRNTAATSTYYTVGAGDEVITAHISQYPDKTLTIYFTDPDTNVSTLVSKTTYKYGSKIEGLKAPNAPNKTTFSTWLGDINGISPSALASTITINSLTTDTVLYATYYYPEAPSSYTLTVYDGSPNGDYTTGTQVPIKANDPNQGWEFYEWEGDTQYLVNQEGLNNPENAVIIPKQSITLRAKFKMIGELPIYDIKVSNGIASGTYYTGKDDNKVEHKESGTEIKVPPGIEVTLTADEPTEGWTFDHWASDDFEKAGVTDIVKTNNPTLFTSVKYNLNIQAVHREIHKCTVHTTNAAGPGGAVLGEGRSYAITGTLKDTDDYHYKFLNWTCVDADGNNCISAIEDPTKIETNITLTDKDLWIEAVYDTYYKLTIVDGQDTGEGYYKEGQVITTVKSNEPKEGSRTTFDHWEDPTGVVKNIYDPTPEITMKNSTAMITAVFVSIDTKGNSVAITGGDIHDAEITRTDSYLINGIYSIGTIAIDKDGCVGVITKIDPDGNDDTDDFQVEKLFYGGNF